MVEPITVTILGITVAVTVIIAAIGTSVKIIKYTIKAGDKIYHHIRRKAEQRFKNYYHFDKTSGVIYNNALQCLLYEDWTKHSKYVMSFNAINESKEIVACILVLRIRSNKFGKVKPKKVRMIYYAEDKRIRIMCKTSSQLQACKDILDKSEFVPESGLQFVKTEANINKMK